MDIKKEDRLMATKMVKYYKNWINRKEKTHIHDEVLRGSGSSSLKPCHSKLAKSV